jgi:hypothetical protein
MLALSSRPWLGYSDQGKFNLVPMSYEALDHASGETTYPAAADGLPLVCVGLRRGALWAGRPLLASRTLRGR